MGPVGRALTALVLLSSSACSRVPIADPYRQGGDGYGWCRELVEAGDKSASLATTLVWLAGVAATCVVFFGGYFAKHQAEVAARFDGLKKWFAVLSGLLASLATASATYMYGHSEAANTAASSAQKTLAKVPAPTSAEYSVMDFGAWQNCQLVAAAWRDNRAKALEDAMNQLDGARKDTVAMATAVEQANDKVQATSSKVSELETTVAEATNAVKAARTVVAEVKAAGASAKAGAKLDDADRKLGKAESGVAAAGSATKAAKASAEEAVVKLNAATRAPTIASGLKLPVKPGSP